MMESTVAYDDSSQHAHARDLAHTIVELMAPSKGILAADESQSTIAKRFTAVGVDPTEENRRRYRQMLLATPELSGCISGVILFDETLRQHADDGRSFVELLVANGIIPGIKVDHGATPLAGAPGERITEGLDGLRERLAEYRSLGARFTKWRGVIGIGETEPTTYCLMANAEALARFAALSQEAGLVPIVEPEILMDGAHTIERAAEIAELTLGAVFNALRVSRVALELMLLKPSMVLPGAQAARTADVATVARATVQVLRRGVPAAVPGIVFLSGGQSPLAATANLNAMNATPESLPWPLGFSFARALQAPALNIWRGAECNVAAAQTVFLHRARCNSAARDGRYSNIMEQADGSVGHDQ